MPSILAKLSYDLLMRYKEMRTFNGDYVEQREVFEKQMSFFPTAKGVSLRSEIVQTAKVEFVDVDEKKRDGLVFYVHGGSFNSGSIRSSRTYLTWFCSQVGMDGVNVEYRLCPEFPFPNGLDDCLLAYRHVLDLGYDPKKIVFLGESAGGNLILALTLKLKQLSLPTPCCILPISPCLVCDEHLPSRIKNVKRDCMISADFDEGIRKTYVVSADVKDPLVAPIFGDFTDFPPVFTVVGEYEMLLDDSILLTKNIRKAGGVAELRVFKKMFHAFACVWALREAKKALHEQTEFIDKHLV